MQERLRWVNEHKLNQPQRGLNPGAQNGDATPVGVGNVLDDDQGSSFLATAGLRAGIPLGILKWNAVGAGRQYARQTNAPAHRCFANGFKANQAEKFNRTAIAGLWASGKRQSKLCGSPST